MIPTATVDNIDILTFGNNNHNQVSIHIIVPINELVNSKNEDMFASMSFEQSNIRWRYVNSIVLGPDGIG